MFAGLLSEGNLTGFSDLFTVFILVSEVRVLDTVVLDVLFVSFSGRSYGNANDAFLFVPGILKHKKWYAPI